MKRLEYFKKIKEEIKLFNTSLKHPTICKKTANILYKVNIKTIGNLLNYTPDDDMTFISGIGMKSIKELTDFLKTKGINWKEYSKKMQ